MTAVKIVADCAAPAETAFDYVNDYRHLPEFVTEVHSFRPITDQVAGLGATFDTEIKLGPASLTSRLQIVRWEKNVAISVKAVTGFEIESTFLFHPRGDRDCTVDAIVEYRVPGGLAGKVLGKTIEPFVKLSVKHTTHNLTTKIAEYQRTLDS
jgi:uncharacterized membrane protein